LEVIDINNTLIQFVDDTLSNIGMPVLEHPIFYHCPIGLRFEISEPWGDNKHFAYFENAYQKAFQVYSDFPAGFDILRIDVHLDAEKSREKQLADKRENLNIICSTTGLPLPADEREILITHNSMKNETDFLLQVECYWNLKDISFDIKSLLMQIILSDFPSQGGGNSQFESSVFLFDTDQNILFHLYDDRGLDLVAKEKSTLYPFYEKYKHWIMDYDKKQIESMFKK
jgi:hypothetical protein